jgi:hypothetical protein
MPPRHSHPLIQKIDAGLDTLDPVFDSFAKAWHYGFSKSVDGDFNPPKRGLDRLPRRPDLHHVISLQVVGRDPTTNAPPEFGPDMPCTLTAFASALTGGRWKCLRRQIFSGLPFSDVRRLLESHLQTAHHQLEDWTYEKVAAEGGED